MRLAAVNALLALYSNADNKAALQASGGLGHWECALIWVGHSAMPVHRARGRQQQWTMQQAVWQPGLSVALPLAHACPPPSAPLQILLQDFTQRFSQRFGELFYDVDEAVAVKGVRAGYRCTGLQAS